MARRVLRRRTCRPQSATEINVDPRLADVELDQWRTLVGLGLEMEMEMKRELELGLTLELRLELKFELA